MEKNLNTTFVTAQQTIAYNSPIRIVHTLQTLCYYLETHFEYGLDTETTSLDTHNVRLLLLIIGDEDEQFVVDCTTIDVSVLKGYFENRTQIKLGQNLKYDYQVLLHCIGVRLENIWDCGLAYQVLNNGRIHSWSLATQVYAYFGVKLEKEERIGFTKLTGDVVNFTIKQIEYAAKDCLYLPGLKRYLIEGREDESLGAPIKGLRHFGLETVVKLENRACLAFADIEYNGFFLDPIYWKDELVPFYTKEKQRVLDELDKTIIVSAKEADATQYIPACTQLDIFGNLSQHLKATKSGNGVSKNKQETKQRKNTGITGINWNSNPQKIKLLKDLGHDVRYKDVKAGKVIDSANKEVLYRYCTPDVKFNIEQKAYDKAANAATNMVDYMLLYTTISKILGTYGLTMLEFINPVTGRVHQTINQLGTESGRISGKNPNLLNIPKQQKFRDGFRIQRSKRKILTLDYSGVELRIIADGAKEPLMIEAFKNNEDVHSKMGMIAYGIEISKKINSKYRDQIKNVNFAIAYGATAKSDKILKAFDSPEDAEKFLKRYFETFPKLKRFFDSARDFAMTKGYCTTFAPFKRIRWFSDWRHYRSSYDKAQKWSPEWKEASKNLNAIGREGMNTPIQGTSADIMKLAMVYIRDWIKENNLWDEIWMVNQVYDELSFEVLNTEPFDEDGSLDFNTLSIHKTLNQSKVEEFAKIIKGFMIQAGAVVIDSVVMEVDYEINEKWQK